ncbi:hypothetical protein GGH95_001544, partial [Coemansia sp. RSA 1836]
LARYAGFYKAIQSIGAAVSWQLDAKNVAFKTQLVVNWALLDVAAVLMCYLSFRISDSAQQLTEDERNMLMQPEAEKVLILDE